MRMPPREKAARIVADSGRDFRAAKRQVSERIVDAAESRHTRAYWRAVFVLVKQLEAGRSLDDHRHIAEALRVGMGDRRRRSV